MHVLVSALVAAGIFYNFLLIFQEMLTILFLTLQRKNSHRKDCKH